MAIYLGSTEITNPFFSNVSEMYVGNTQIWPTGLPAGTIFNFSYTGTVQSIELPRGKYKLQCWGAQGGSNYEYSYNSGGFGGYSEGVLTLDKTTTLYVFVGGVGDYNSSSSYMENGGWNGGGGSYGYSSYSYGGESGYSYCGSGGGATDFATVSSSMDYSSGRTNRSSASLLSRCIVAGGGGGSSYGYYEWQTTSTSTVETEVAYMSDYATTYNSSSKDYYAIDRGYYRCYPGEVWYVDIDESSQNKYYITCHNSSGSAILNRTNNRMTIPSDGYSITFRIYAKTEGEYVAGTLYKETTETVTDTDSDYDYTYNYAHGGGTSGTGSYPGTQSSAGSGGGFGYGGSVSTSNYMHCSGGGGGGWYGGAANWTDGNLDYIYYNGGGSGFVNTAANASYRPSGYTGLQLDSGSTKAGNTSFPSVNGGTEYGHAGNGYARITVL